MRLDPLVVCGGALPPPEAAVSVPKARPAGHPLGPRVRLVPLSHRVWGRLLAALLAVVAGGVFAVAAMLAPRHSGIGTHEQLGLPRCGFVTLTGLPCPTCGMTTAFAHAARGHFLAAIRAQLFGSVLAMVTAAVGLGAAVAVVTGRRPAVNWYRLDPTRLVWWATGSLIASWGIKMAIGLADGTLPAR